MATPNIVNVRNKTERPITLAFNGRVTTIPAYEEIPLNEELAQAFLAHHHASVEIAADDIIVPEPVQAKPKEFWIANLTGNPMSPETIPFKEYDKVTKELKTVHLANPYKRAYPLHLEMSGNEVYYRDAMGDASYYEPAIIYRIPPYTACKVPENFFNWAIQRAANSSMSGEREYGPCDPLPEFLPNKKDWSIAKLQTYLQLLDPSILDLPKAQRSEILGKSEASIMVVHKADPTGAIFDIAKAKNDLVKQIFFRLVDNRYRRPMREEVESMMMSAKGDMPLNNPIPPPDAV